MKYLDRLRESFHTSFECLNPTLSTLRVLGFTQHHRHNHFLVESVNIPHIYSEDCKMEIQSEVMTFTDDPSHLQQQIIEMDTKFRKACSQVLLLNSFLKGFQRRYDRAAKDNLRENLPVPPASTTVYHPWKCETVT